MSKRIKPVSVTPAIHSLEEADAMLARISARKRALDLFELGLKEDVDKLKLACASQCDPIKQEIKEMEQSLLRFAEARKEELFSRKKSVALNFGSMGFRASATLKTLKKAITWERVLGMLKEMQFTGCIRTREEVDKDALRQLPPESLTLVGCKLVQEDAFYYELAETEMADTDSAA